MVGVSILCDPEMGIAGIVIFSEIGKLISVSSLSSVQLLKNNALINKIDNNFFIKNIISR
jgi:hypothetical protein